MSESDWLNQMADGARSTERVDRMKVVMLLGRSTGGIGTHVAHLGADLRERGVDVLVVTHPLTAASFDLGPVRLWWPGSTGWVGGLRDFRLLRRLAATADIVHAHGHQGGLLGILLRPSPVTGRDRRQRPKIIVSQHNAVLEGSGHEGLKRAAQRWVARRADLVTGASSDLVEEAVALGAGRAELAEVPSPSVPELLAQPPADRSARARIRQTLLSKIQARQTTQSEPADAAGRANVVVHGAAVDLAVPLVVTISRIAPQKDLPVLVKAASLMRQPCTWVVLGDGDLKLLGELRRQAHALAAPVHFVGARSDVGQWLRAAEVFVLPSRWEARALVVQEAMAAGTPVVATDVGGLHDLVAGNGLLVIPGDPEAIAEATDRILADPGLREELAGHGRQVAEGLPDGGDTASWWLARYNETLLLT